MSLPLQISTNQEDITEFIDQLSVHKDLMDWLTFCEICKVSEPDGLVGAF